MCVDVSGNQCLLSVYNVGPASAQFAGDAVITIADAHVLIADKTIPATATTTTTTIGTASVGGAPISFCSLGLPVVQVFDLDGLAFNGRAFSDTSYSRPSVTFETTDK
jgi:hypothetical protein